MSKRKTRFTLFLFFPFVRLLHLLLRLCFIHLSVSLPIGLSLLRDNDRWFVHFLAHLFPWNWIRFLPSAQVHVQRYQCALRAAQFAVQEILPFRHSINSTSAIAAAPGFFLLFFHLLLAPISYRRRRRRGRFVYVIASDLTASDSLQSTRSESIACCVDRSTSSLDAKKHTSPNRMDWEIIIHIRNA